MVKYLPLYDNMEEDDYIDIDISSKEFEFQMSFNPIERETTSSPADELFYKWKLLPLHLPPRLQMAQKLLENSTNSHESNTNALEATTTPFQSCNISTATSCHVSSELSLEQYMHEPKRSWSKKLKLVRQSCLSLKLKASKAYLKSLFTTKSEHSDSLKADKSLFARLRKETWLIQNTDATSLTKSIKREKTLEEECAYRKSFSGAINCNLVTRSSPAMSSRSSSSSSFSSVSSNGLHGSQVLNRSSNVDSEMQSSIQGAIAYCKESQISARKSVSGVDFCTLSATRIAAVCENQERTGLCRG